MTERAAAETPAGTPVRLWDLPVRLVHWSFVVLIALLWWSAEERDMDLHFTLGLVMLGLIVFRLLWGLVGSSTARFASFVKGPAAIRAYLAGLKSGTGPHVVGHNPLGALSVLALVGLIAAQVGLGLFAQDHDAINSGPLNFLVSYDTASAISEVHEALFNVILAVIALHVGAILFYRFIKRDNLVTPMITGRRVFETAVATPRIAPLWVALVCAALAAAIAVWVSWGLPPFATPFPWNRAVEAAPDPSSYM
ncbi:cytochrome b/b6 domain-containing protein [Novosphingobium bradum]|uniref:Cytochrome b/b6 domain-containing protein n=1 Tax=Novosphingobium bradum TaxID=1737444 RepID=A0ABV7IP82_9SPHN